MSDSMLKFLLKGVIYDNKAIGLKMTILDDRILPLGKTGDFW